MEYTSNEWLAHVHYANVYKDDEDDFVIASHLISIASRSCKSFLQVIASRARTMYRFKPIFLITISLIGFVSNINGNNHIHLHAGASTTQSAVSTIHTTDSVTIAGDTAFEHFQSFVYPPEFVDSFQSQPQLYGGRGAVRNHVLTRNITLLAIQHVLLPTTKIPNHVVISDLAANVLHSENDSRHEFQRQLIHENQDNTNDHQLHHINGQPNTFYGNSDSHAISHVINPLFFMATLTFVVFLVNSILSLVDRINLTPAAVIRLRRRRHGQYRSDVDSIGHFDRYRQCMLALQC